MQWEENFMQVVALVYLIPDIAPRPRLPPNLTHAFLLFPAFFANVY